MSGRTLRDLLRTFRNGAPSRAEYEKFLRTHGVIGANERLGDRPDIALDVYCDWQRRAPVACMFARLIARNPSAHDVAWEMIPTPIDEQNVAGAADQIAQLVEQAKGQEESIVILLPAISEAKSLILLCKAIGRCESWSVRAPYNPSDRFDRIYVRMTTVIGPNVEAEILGVGPFAFLPPTRQSPITALHIRTKTEGAKPRSPGSADKAHLANMDWPGGRDRRFKQLWKGTAQSRVAVLGGDDSAARARITFAIPRTEWDGVTLQT